MPSAERTVRRAVAFAIVAVPMGGCAWSGPRELAGHIERGAHRGVDAIALGRFLAASGEDGVGRIRTLMDEGG